VWPQFVPSPTWPALGWAQPVDPQACTDAPPFRTPVRSGALSSRAPGSQSDPTDGRFTTDDDRRALYSAGVILSKRRNAAWSAIERYVPSFPRKRYPITVRQLLSHQAGIRHYKIALFQPGFSESNLNREFSSVEASLALFRNDPLRFEPDTSFLYSTFGLTLVSAAIEGATGRPFLDVMRAELFSPLGMSRTEPDVHGLPHPAKTVDYVTGSDPRSVRTAPRTNSSYKWAGGGFLSTPTDLAGFAAALLDGRIVSPETRTLMFTPRRLRNGTENAQRYGLGWRVSAISDRADPARVITFVHHGGTAAGSEAALLMLPESRVVVAITGNANTGGSEAMIQAASVIARRFAQGR
jgi:serine beta-lactamase-like protein LACTB